MEMKQAVAAAKDFATTAFDQEDLRQIRLEEIEIDEANDEWLITLGLYRPTITNKATQIIDVFGETHYNGSYKIFRVSNKTGKVLSVKMRPFAGE